MDLNHWETILNLQHNQPGSLGMELEKLACHQGDKTALIYQDRRISYEELNRQSNRYANYFNEQGFAKGDVVVLLMGNRPDYLFAVSGLSKLGVIVSLVNTGIRGDVLAHDINICEARAIIVDQELLNVYEEVASTIRMRSPGSIFVMGGEDKHPVPDNMLDLGMLLTASSDNNPSTTGSIYSEDLLLYVYTAGHQGLRKAVPVTHQRWLIKGHQFVFSTHLNQQSVQYLCLPLYYNSGICLSYAALIISGSTMVLRQKFSVHNFWNDMRVYGVNYVISVAEMVRYLYNQPEKVDDADNPLEIMICVGSLRDTVEPFRQRFGLKHFIEVFAMTEGVGTFINFEEVAKMCGNLNFYGARQGEVVQYDFRAGKMKTGADGKALKCSPGEVGLLLCEINELNKFAGYLQDPEATEQMVLTHVLRAGDQYLNSGDLVQLHDDDYISYVDRLGDTYRWKSITVSAHQVADVITKFYGGIEEAVVYGMKISGLEGRCGMAAVKIFEGEYLDWESLSQHIKRRMPEHARPVFIRIVPDLHGDQDSEELKQTLREDGFNPDLVRDPIYFLDPQLEKYIPLTTEIYTKILSKDIKL